MKLPFYLENKLNKILKPQLVTIVTLETLNEKIKFFGKSVTGNFLQLIYCQWSYVNTTNFVASGTPLGNGILQRAKQTNDTFVDSQNEYQKLTAPVANSSYGILFGTGATPPSPSDYVMESIISNGVGVGQFNYEAQKGIQGCEVSGQQTSFKIQRLATNNSGGDITVKEVGIVVKTASGHLHLIFRDLVNITITNGQPITATIQFLTNT